MPGSEKRSDRIKQAFIQETKPNLNSSNVHLHSLRSIEDVFWVTLRSVDKREATDVLLKGPRIKGGNIVYEMRCPDRFCMSDLAKVA